MSQNLNDLIEAGKKVLKQQEKAEKLTGDDPYSFLMEEEANPVTPLVPPVPSEIPGIKNVPTEEELKQMEEAYQPTEERIFENGPYASEAKLWKKQYGDGNVFHVEIGGRAFVFRTLNRYEYKEIMALQNTDPLYREEAICTQCVLFPIGYSFKTMATDNAGYPATLSNIIMEYSGFTRDYGIEVI